MCYGCYLYYEVNNPSVLKDFVKGLIMKDERKTNSCINCNAINMMLTASNQYICSSCEFSNGYKSVDSIQINYYKKRPY